MKKRLPAIFLAIVILLSLTVPALAVVEQSKEYYVADYAGVLSSNVKNAIMQANAQLEQQCNGAQIVVVSIEYLNGIPSDEYANQLFNNWGVGSSNANNGMLLLFVTEEGKGWLATGAGIRSVFTDNMANDYLNNYFWDDFDRGNYDKAVTSLMTHLVKWYNKQYDANVSFSGSGNVYAENEPSSPGALPWIFAFISRNAVIILFVVALFFLSVSADKRRYRAYYSYMGMPIPPYYFWYMWGRHRPHRHWHDPRGPGGSGGPGGFGGFGGMGRGGGGGGFGGGGRGGFGGFGGGGGGFSGGGGGGRR